LLCDLAISRHPRASIDLDLVEWSFHEIFILRRRWDAYAIQGFEKGQSAQSCPEPQRMFKRLIAKNGMVQCDGKEWANGGLKKKENPVMGTGSRLSVF
jgi:hypothetical protein